MRVLAVNQTSDCQGELAYTIVEHCPFQEFRAQHRLAEKVLKKVGDSLGSVSRLQTGGNKVIKALRMVYRGILAIQV